MKLTRTGQTTAYGASDVFHVDTTAPTFTSFPLAHDAADGTVNASEVTNDQELAGPLSGSEMDQISYVIRLAAQSCSTASGWGSSLPKAGDLAGYVNASYKVCVRIADDAGNTIYNNSPSFALDKDAPVFSSVSLTKTVFNATDVAGSTALVSAATGASFDHAYYKIVASTVLNCSTGITFDQPVDTIPTAADLSSSNDGSYKVCVKLTDDGGNPPSYGISSAFLFDKTPPVLPSDNSHVLIWKRLAHSIEVEWLPSSDAVTSANNLQYALYYSTSSSFDNLGQVKSGTLFSTGSSTLRTVTGLNANTTYYFNVIAIDETGNEVLYNKGSVKTANELAAFVKIKASADAFCALNTDAQLFCWGSKTNFLQGIGNPEIKDGSSNPMDEKFAISSMVPHMTFTDFGMGTNFACGINSTNGLTYCWGNNTYGQLGVNDNTVRYVPTATTGDYLFTKIAVGATHACGITSAGAAYCWGNNVNGQAGDNTVGTYKYAPVAVNGGLSFTNIAVGDLHSCGITSVGAAYCWGYNAYGQLGDTTATQRLVPTPVAGGFTFSSIYAGFYRSCALTAAGAAYCWGYNPYGHLGDGTNASKSTPTAVLGSLVFDALGSMHADHTCGHVGGAAYCWGYNAGYQLGDLSNTNRWEPTAVDGSRSFSAVAAGTSASCGISSGKIYCWGTGADELASGGTSSNITLKTPTAAIFRPIATSLAVGNAFGCAVQSDAKTYCWGNNTHGNTGNHVASTRGARTPLSVNTVAFERVYGGGYRTICGSHRGQLYCWGDNGSNQLGYPGAGASSWIPLQVQTDQRFLSASGSSMSTNGFMCALSLSGDAYCWGDNTYGQLGSGDTSSAVVPQKVLSTEKFAAISVGSHACALTPDGRAFCWGLNGNGQLGDGTTTARSAPVSVSGGLTFKTIVAGMNYTCGVTTAGAAYCWGMNSDSQLGDGTTTARSAPVSVSGGLTFKTIAAGIGHTCAVTTTGTAYCWGLNGTGQLGDGTTVGKNTPTAVLGGYAFDELGLMQYSTCGLRTDGFTMCWGSDTSGALGNNHAAATTAAKLPVYVDD